MVIASLALLAACGDEPAPAAQPEPTRVVAEAPADPATAAENTAGWSETNLRVLGMH